MTKALGRQEFLAVLRDNMKGRYQDRHPIMLLLYEGRLTHKQMKAWIVNRFYLQKNVPIKDAAVLSNCPETEVRKMWISRMLRREGIGQSIGDVEGWISFAEAAGISSEDLLRARFLPGVRFAVDGYVNFARRATWIEGVAASLFEYFAKDELLRRVDAFKKFYPWIEPHGLKFFMSRLSQLDVTNEGTLGIIMKYCRTRKLQMEALAAAIYMSEVTWSLHDAVYMAYVLDDRPLSDSF